jgi:hypothetical protein
MYHLCISVKSFSAPLDIVLFVLSATISETNFLIPFKAASGVADNQLKPGNSAHKPTCSLSSPDHVMRYVYLSFFNAVIYFQLELPGKTKRSCVR